MPLSKVFRVLAASAGGLVAVAGLSYQSVTALAATEIKQDFIVTGLVPEQGSDRELVAGSEEPKALANWEFTDRIRPIKCRFVR